MESCTTLEEKILDARQVNGKESRMTTLEVISKICETLLGLYVLASISIILEVQRRINRKMNELIFHIEQYREEQEDDNT